MTGTLPESFREMSSLVTLSLGENSFSGTVPRDLGNLVGLKFLYADNNHLVGLLPPSLARSGVIVNNGVNEKTEKKNDVAIGSAMVSYIFSLYYKLSRGEEKEIPFGRFCYHEKIHPPPPRATP